MANKQYIGARYVPKFYEGSNGNNWDSGVSYEPLTIVTWLKDSYTSKIPVPDTIGNPANNPKYWAHTGAYNAQIEQYREEVENIADFVNEQAGKSQAYKVESFKPYAQILAEDVYGNSDITGVYAQGFCVAKATDLRPLVLFQAFTNTEDSDDCGIFVYNILSDHVIKAQHGLSLGHANDVTYNPTNGHWYVACAGGQNGEDKIVEFTENGSIFKTHTFDDETIHPYAICYDEDEDVFYALVGDNRCVTFDSEIEEQVDEFSFNPPNYTAQSMFMMYDRIVMIYTKYFSVGKGTMSIGVVYNKDGTLFGTFTFPTFGEVESCTFENGVIYANMNTDQTSLVVLCSCDRGNIVFDSFNYNNTGKGIGLNGQYNEYYIDTEAENIMVDGSENLPFRKFYPCVTIAQVNWNEFTRFHISGTVKNNINIKGSGGRYAIIGERDAVIAGIHIENASVAFLNNLTINAAPSTFNAFIDVEFVEFANIINVVFNHSSDDAFDIAVREASNCYLNNVDATHGGISTTSTTGKIYAANGSKVKFVGGADVDIIQTQGFASEAEFEDFNNVGALGTQLLLAGVTYDVAKMFKGGKYRFEPATRFLHLPTFVNNIINSNDYNGDIVVTPLRVDSIAKHSYIEIIPLRANFVVEAINKDIANSSHIMSFNIKGRLSLAASGDSNYIGSAAPDVYVEGTQVMHHLTATASTDIPANTTIYTASGLTADGGNRYLNGFDNAGNLIPLVFVDGALKVLTNVANGTTFHIDGYTAIPDADRAITVV